LEYFTELLRIREKNFDLKNRKLVSCLEEYFRPGSPDTPVVFASTDHAHVICWKPPDESHAKILCRELHGNILCRESHAILCAGEAYRETHTVCELGVKQLSTADKERIKLKQQEDLAILEDFIETLISDSDYHRVLEKVEKILMDSSQYCISGYNHTGYLMMRFGDLVRDAYNSDDKSMKALHFYDKVQFILKNKISRWANTKYVQDICFKRIEQKQIHDYFILTKLIDILKNDANYDMGLEIVKNLLMESSQPLISGYNHTEYLMTRFGDLAMDAYDSDDNSIKAFCFYDKVRFILKKKISHWANTEDIENMCSKRIEQKKIHDRSILKKPTDILSKGGDYDMAFERMKGVLMESCQPFISGYNHTEYLMTCLLPLVMNTHDSYDESIKALDFYEKIQFILENVISRWGNTDYIQIIFLERIGHIRQINNRYESAIECFERSVKMQREHEKSLIDIPDTLRSIGLLHMTLGNYEPAKASFEETRKLLQSDFPEKEREIRLLNKRINQATEGLKL
jgi:tetratricopeptide (TPR) repeat protein